MLEIVGKGLPGAGLIYEGRILHNPKWPVEEARAHISRVKAEGKGLLLVFGVGLGYHLRELAEQWPLTRMVAFEPVGEIHQACMEMGGLDGLMPERVEIASDWSALDETLTREIVHGPHPDPVVFIQPGYASLFRAQAEAFERLVQGARLRRAVEDRTRNEKRGLFLDNLADNLPFIMTRPLLTALKNRFTNRPGFVVGSGPGLEKNGRLLSDLHERGLILAAGSAFKPLRRMGVTPDITVVVEAEDTSGYLKDVGYAQGRLLALASTAHPHHYSLSGFTPAVFHLTAGPAWLFGTDDFAPHAGTAGSAAFTLGLLLGLNPLVLVGQDQAYDEGRLHASDTPGDDSAAGDSGRFRVAGGSDREVATHSGFAASLHWYAESAGYLRRTAPDRIVLNASESGARIPGVPEATLADVIAGLPSIGDRTSIVSALDDVENPDPRVVHERLAETWQLVGQLASVLRMAPDQAPELIEEVRLNHPFLHEVLPSSGPSGWKALLGAAETRLIKMIDRLERDD